MKACKLCGEVKNESEFFPSKSSKGGLMARCRKCVSKKSYESRKRRLTEMLPQQVADVKRRHSLATVLYFRRYPEKALAAAQRYREKNRVRINAAQKLSYAVKIGHVVREPCCVCGAEKAYGHHADYDQPLQVIWLCREHKREVQRLAKALDKALGPL